MPHSGGKRKKTRTHNKDSVPKGASSYDASTKGSIALKTIDDNIPKSIVAKASKVIAPVSELIKDIRRMMSPNTAAKLKEKNYNRMKDYSSVATVLGVSHLIVISQTKSNIVLRVGKTPIGPTLHFQILKFSLVRHVRALQKRPFESSSAFMTSPLVVLNNFSVCDDSHVKLMKITFQNMFPSINVKTVKLTDCRRVVLFHYNMEDGTVSMRHYAVKATPVGINKNIKKIMQSHIPNLGNLQDISEFLEGSLQAAGGGIYPSDSEADDDDASKVTLADRYTGKGNARNQQSAMKLVELGPRLTLQLYKVEKGICEGDVLYHKYEVKTPEEAMALKHRVEKDRLLKIERKAKQEDNVKKKKEMLEKKKEEKAVKRQKKEESKLANAGTHNSQVDDDDDDDDEDDDDNDDDDDDDSDDDIIDEDDLDDDDDDVNDDDNYDDNDDDDDDNNDDENEE